MKALRALYGRFEHLVHETLKFGAVGGFGVIVNILVFNVCLYQLDLAPVRSSIISTAVAIGVNYLGNRFWAFRHRKSADQRRELVLFLLFSGVGMAIEAGAVAISHYLLDFTSTKADNIAKYAIGLPLGTLFRFWSYRTWVFTGTHAAQLDSEAARLVEEESTPTGR
ncbi:GtrA family protein [Yinghuangia soli]|uniref:GtrA family protein n=1 Tax=Yinghuangia soli TaxID=2908204 RepID=A0AA41Q8G0_9ACTN|nr:GtrA family protein [Yinghuangia soli]MCF2532656.1 GtrA family protein [Yinghuangia soli]